MQHIFGILPVNSQRLLPLPQSGGGKGGLGGPLHGVADAIGMAAQTASPCSAAPGFFRQDDPAAAHPGKAIGFGKAADLDGTAICPRHGIDAAGQRLPGEEGRIGGIHQQQAAAFPGKAHPSGHFEEIHGGPGGVIGGAKDDKAGLRDRLRAGQKAVLFLAGQRKNGVACGLGGGTVGGVGRVAHPHRHRAIPQRKKRPDGFLTAGGDGDLRRGDGAGQAVIAGGDRPLQKGVAGGRAVAPLAALRGKLGGGGTHGFGGDRCNGPGDIPDAEGEDGTVGAAQLLGGGCGGDAGEQVVLPGEEGGIEWQHGETSLI